RRALCAAVVDAQVLRVGARAKAAGLAGAQAVEQLLGGAEGRGGGAGGAVATRRGRVAVAGDRGRAGASTEPQNRSAERRCGNGQDELLGHERANPLIE